MNIRDRLVESTGDNELLFADGFDEAVIGIASRGGAMDVVCYDYDKCAEILVERDGMTFDEALEYMEFNVVGSYVGERTPTFMKSSASLL